LTFTAVDFFLQGFYVASMDNMIRPLRGHCSSKCGDPFTHCRSSNPDWRNPQLQC